MGHALFSVREVIVGDQSWQKPLCAIQRGAVKHDTCFETCMAIFYQPLVGNQHITLSMQEKSR